MKTSCLSRSSRTLSSRAPAGRRFSLAAGLACLGLLGACSFGRAPSAYELDPIENASAPRAPLPDEAERLAAELVEWSLEEHGDPEVARNLLQLLEQKDYERKHSGELVTGLVDNALDMFNSTRGEEAFRKFAEDMLSRGRPDGALERKLRSYLDSQPLRVAKRRLGERRRRRFGQVFNRLVAPIPRTLVGDPTAPLEAGRALIYSYTVLRSGAQASTEERQALRAYNEFLQSNPGSPEAADISLRAQTLSRKLREQRLREDFKAARDSIAAGRPDAALIHLARADQTSPEDERTAALRRRAAADLFLQEQRLRITLTADPERGSAFASLSGGSQEPLVAEMLESPPEELDKLRAHWPRMDADLMDEMAFIDATEKLQKGDEDGYFAKLAELSRQPGNMARHAASALESPEQNPYAHYRAVRKAFSRQLTRSVLFGNLSNGIPGRALPLPLRVANGLLEVPYYIAIPIIGLPFRLLQYSSTKARLSGGVLDAGELYLQRFPKGAHAQEMHRALEELYADRRLWNKALEHHEARADAKPAKIRSYRAKIADRTLEFARLEDRPLDLRMAVYTSLVREYGDTDAGRTAGRELEQLRGKYTPQSIRLTRSFLRENPEIWQPGALGLRPELLDGRSDNGELAEDGVRLIGKNYVELQFEDRDPLQRPIPAENFVRFVSLLEEVRYRKMARDGREQTLSDPQLDLFLERARLGLLDQSDYLPAATARSSSVMMSAGEETSGLKRAESILPIELVVRGGLSDAGLSALPRIKLPAETPDAFLYK